MPLFGGGKPDVKKLEAKHDVKGLISALGYDKDVMVRVEAVEALGRLKDVRAVEPLIALLQTDIVSYVAPALGALGDVRAVEPLIAALQASWEQQHIRVLAEALGKLGDVRAAQALSDVLTRHPKWDSGPEGDTWIKV